MKKEDKIMWIVAVILSLLAIGYGVWREIIMVQFLKGG